MRRVQKFRGLLFLAISILLVRCLESYQPPAITDNVNILVVDGFINGSDGSAKVKLSRATPLSSNDLSPIEAGATVVIEDNSGNSYTLSDAGDGSYIRTGLNLLATNKYRLITRLSNGNEYSSDYIEITQAPPIDSITWKQIDDALVISVNTHDASSSTKYYQWLFEETWEYTSRHYSYFKMLNGEPVLRDDNINLCWDTSSSSEILIASSEQLSDDIIHDFPISTVPKTSGKISKRYSIMVEQRALTRDAYNFWLQLKKTTESLGGLFDPLPSQVLGNITSVNTPEPVLGYFSGGYISKKRFFITFSELPSGLRYNPHNNDRCELDSIRIRDLTSFGPNLLLIAGYPDSPVLGYTTASSECIDCRLLGGNNLRPDFW